LVGLLRRFPSPLASGSAALAQRIYDLQPSNSFPAGAAASADLLVDTQAIPENVQLKV
jgi:hypothetical protein